MLVSRPGVAHSFQKRSRRFTFCGEASFRHLPDQLICAVYALHVHPIVRKSFTAGRMSLLMPRLSRYSASGAQPPPTEPVNGRQSACDKPWQLKSATLRKPRTSPPRLFSSNSSSKVPALPLPRHTRADATETPITTAPRLALESLFARPWGRLLSRCHVRGFEACRLERVRLRAPNTSLQLVIFAGI